MLGLPPLPRTIAAALRDSEHPREHVRTSALADLVRLSRLDATRAAAIPGMLRVLAKDPSAGLRAEAALALADADASEARGGLFSALEDVELRVRQFAVLALGELAEPGDAELAQRLLELSESSEAALRFQALVALERIAPERSEGALERGVEDTDDEVRAMAFRIAERRWPAGSAAPAWLTRAARSALSAASSNVRAAAAFALAAQRDPAANAVLVGVLDGSVRIGASDDLQTAIELAVTLGLDAARAPLARRAFGVFGVRSDPIAWHACVALARLGDARARQAILRRLAAFRYDVRTLAVAAAGQARLREARAQIESFRADPSRAAPEAVAEALRLLESGD